MLEILLGGKHDSENNHSNREFWTNYNDAENFFTPTEVIQAEWVVEDFSGQVERRDRLRDLAYLMVETVK